MGRLRFILSPSFCVSLSFSLPISYMYIDYICVHIHLHTLTYTHFFLIFAYLNVIFSESSTLVAKSCSLQLTAGRASSRKFVKHHDRNLTLDQNQFGGKFCPQQTNWAYSHWELLSSLTVFTLLLQNQYLWGLFYSMYYKEAERNQNFNLHFGGHFHFAPALQFPRLDIQV